LFASCGIHLRLSCPYTSPQNGKAEQILRTLNNISRTMLIHAHLLAPYWAEALAMVTYLLNRRPCSAVRNVHMLYFTTRHLITPTFVFLGVSATQT
jgi:histone deacetylase 1/2